MRVLESPISEVSRGVVGTSLAVAALVGAFAMVPDSALTDFTQRGPNGADSNLVAADETNSIGGYVPRTDLGRKLLKLRQQYAAKGGKFLNREELDAEIALRKGRRD